MMRKKLIILAVIITLFLGLRSVAFSAWGKKDKEDLYREVDLFANTLAIVQSDYVDEVSPKELIYGALNGMLASLDPHSQFLDPESYNELKVDTQGKFGGLGIEITIKDGLLTIVTPIEDTPAWNAGVKAGDRIVKINQELTRDINLIDAAKKLRGVPGSSVDITVLRESGSQVIDFKITRDIINIKDIKEAKILEGGIGYIRLSEFRENTAREFKLALERLKKGGMKAFILDLRNNPGGLLDNAVKLTEEFVKQGSLIVYTKSREAQQTLEFYARQNRPDVDLPMVVLINEGSASGSEIVAAALQDYKRAIIVGKKSFGKGSVQTIIPLGDGSALKLTTSRYYTPLGRAIHDKGVIPDIVIDEGIIESFQDKEEGEGVQPDKIFEQIENKINQLTSGIIFDYKSDPQIMGGIDALKAILIYKNIAKE